MKPTFQGEVQLAGWSETHTGGCKITLWLSDPSDLDVFRALTVRKGNTAGHRLACVLVEIGDDEQPVEPPASEKPKGGPLAKLAGQWSNDPIFWEWLEEEVGRKVASAEDAAGLVRHICMVASRAELDNDAAAADRFHRLVRRPYADWLEWRRTS